MVEAKQHSPEHYSRPKTDDQIQRAFFSCFESVRQLTKEDFLPAGTKKIVRSFDSKLTTSDLIRLSQMTLQEEIKNRFFPHEIENVQITTNVLCSLTSLGNISYRASLELAALIDEKSVPDQLLKDKNGNNLRGAAKTSRLARLARNEIIRKDPEAIQLSLLGTVIDIEQRRLEEAIRKEVENPVLLDRLTAFAKKSLKNLFYSISITSIVLALSSSGTSGQRQPTTRESTPTATFAFSTEPAKTTEHTKTVESPTNTPEPTSTDTPEPTNTPTSDPSDIPEPTDTPTQEPTATKEPEFTESFLYKFIRAKIAEYNQGLNIPEEFRNKLAVLYVGIKGSENYPRTNRLGQNEFHTDGNLIVSVLADNGQIKISIITPYTRDLVIDRDLDGKKAKIKQLWWMEGEEAWRKEMEKMTGIEGRSLLVGFDTIRQFFVHFYPEGLTLNNPTEFTSIGGIHFPKGKIKLDQTNIIAYISERKAFDRQNPWPNNEGKFTLQGDEARAQKGVETLKQILLGIVTDPRKITKISSSLDLLSNPQVREVLKLKSLNALDLAKLAIDIGKELLSKPSQKRFTLQTLSPTDIENLSQAVWFRTTWHEKTDGITDLFAIYGYVLPADAVLPSKDIGKYNGRLLLEMMTDIDLLAN